MLSAGIAYSFGDLRSATLMNKGGLRPVSSWAKIEAVRRARLLCHVAEMARSSCDDPAGARGVFNSLFSFLARGAEVGEEK